MPNGLCGRAGCFEPLSSKKSSYCVAHRREWDRIYLWHRTPKGLETGRRGKFRRTYGITVEDAESILVSQGGVCAICHHVPEPWCTDHDHVTGAIRGIVCRRCNAVLGMALDDPSVLRAAAEYLEAHLVPPG